MEFYFSDSMARSWTGITIIRSGYWKRRCKYAIVSMLSINGDSMGIRDLLHYYNDGVFENFRVTVYFVDQMHIILRIDGNICQRFSPLLEW